MLKFNESGKRECFQRTDPEVKIIESLNICRKTAHLLKEKFPNEIMKLEYDTIIMFDKKDRRIKGDRMSGYAYYSNATPHRVIIRKKSLIDTNIARTKIKGPNTSENRPMLNGNFSLAELIAHELAHHRTKGHSYGWQEKYLRFIQFVVNQFISGQFYKASTEAGGEST